ncbi:hypothetical protein C0995_000701, partial [Termitomyces sp. Mi166
MQPCAASVRGQEAGFIEQAVFLQDSARHNISALGGTSTATVRHKQRAPRQAQTRSSSGGSASTPIVKSGNLEYPTKESAKITLCFLHYGILSVKFGKTAALVERDDWIEACLHAASLARLASKAGKVNDRMKKSYSWSWSEHLSTGTERGAQQFFNIVGVLGYIFGNLFNLDTKNLSERRLRTRITTLPCAYHRLPLELPDSQDCRPDFFVLHRSSFVAKSERESIRTSEYMEKSSILLTIGLSWPERRGDGANSRDQANDDVIVPPSFTPEGYDELLDDVINGKYNPTERVEETDASSKDAQSLTDLSLQLEELLKVLEARDTPNLSDSVSANVKKYDNGTFLDLST